MPSCLWSSRSLWNSRDGCSDNPRRSIGATSLPTAVGPPQVYTPRLCGLVLPLSGAAVASRWLLLMQTSEHAVLQQPRTLQRFRSIGYPASPHAQWQPETGSLITSADDSSDCFLSCQPAGWLPSSPHPSSASNVRSILGRYTTGTGDTSAGSPAQLAAALTGLSVLHTSKQHLHRLNCNTTRLHNPQGHSPKARLRC